MFWTCKRLSRCSYLDNFTISHDNKSVAYLSRNSEIMGGYTTTPLHRWGELVSTKFSQMSRDSMNRIIGKVEVRVNPSSTLGVDGVLHLRPEYLTPRKGRVKALKPRREGHRSRVTA